MQKRQNCKFNSNIATREKNIGLQLVYIYLKDAHINFNIMICIRYSVLFLK